MGNRTVKESITD